MAGNNVGAPNHNFVWDTGLGKWVRMTQPGGSGGGGTSSDFGDPVPASGTAVGFQDSGGNLAPGLLDASGFLKVNVAAGGAGGGAATIADGADVAEGATTDAAVLDADGTVNAHIRGLDKILADVWDSVNHRFKVNVENASLTVASHAVTNAGTFAVQESGTQVQVDDAAFAPATSKVTMVGAEFDDAATDSVDEGDGGAVRMSANRNLYVRVRDNAGNERGLNIDANGGAAVAGTGTAGTAAGGVLTVQGVASMTKLLVTPDSVALPANQSVNVSQINGVTPLMGAGNTGTGSPRVTIATDQAVLPVAGTGTAGSAATGVVTVQGIASGTALTVASHAVTNAGTFAVQESGTQVQVDDAAFTPATSKIVMAGFTADESSTDSVDEGDGGAARMTLDRKVIVTVEPHTTGGWDTKCCTSGDGSTALTNSAQAVKASAGKLGGWYIYNPNTSATYVIIYNVASGSVTVGTTNPQIVLCIPASAAANVEFVNGITFDTAIAVAATTTGAGNSAPASALEANFFYK